MCEIDQKVTEVAKKYFANSTATALINESKPKFELVRAPVFAQQSRSYSFALTPLTPPSPPSPAALHGRCPVHG